MCSAAVAHECLAVTKGVVSHQRLQVDSPAQRMRYVKTHGCAADGVDAMARTGDLIMSTMMVVVVQLLSLHCLRMHVCRLQVTLHRVMQLMGVHSVLHASAV
jgi:hypothetical protein